MKQIKEVPIWFIKSIDIIIYNKIIYNQEKHGKGKNKNITLNKSYSQGNFNWEKTKEGHIYWNMVNKRFKKIFNNLPNIDNFSII